VPAAINRVFAGDTPTATAAFTLVELLVVITIIIILAGLILATVGYVQKKGATSRAAAEIAAMSAALESYKADNGIYPRSSDTDALSAQMKGNPADYQAASLYLYTQLSATNADGTVIAGARVYFTFKPQMLNTITTTTTDAFGNITTTTTVKFIRDPFGNSYGYSTAQAANPGGNAGYNPTYDLWSTAGLTTNPSGGGGGDAITPQWIKNW
jgi:type II secretory pathway pseudopilin PulG